MPVIETKGAASSGAYGQFARQVAANYIEDVFSTWLYTGNGSTQTITNGIDLSTKGGLVWMKSRSGATAHALYDTARGATKDLVSNTSDAETTQATGLTSFTSSGFSIGSLAKLNTNAATYASWTFREQPKFFDVVTYTGNGANRTIAHNLGSVPGCIMVKRIDGYGGNWVVYHRSLSNTQGMYLNQTAAAVTDSTFWNSTTPTSTNFSLGTNINVNATDGLGGTYVAYLFAHDAGGFGAAGTDNVISCGSYTGNGSATGPTVTLGYEPQWVMIKAASSTSQWHMYDTMRGWTDGSIDSILYANLSNAEDNTNSNLIRPLATGFQLTANYTANTNGVTYIYMAIRRGPMRTPTSGTSVYSSNINSDAAGTVTNVGFPADLILAQTRLADRLRGFASTTNSTNNPQLATFSTNGETTNLTPNWYNVWNTTAVKGDFSSLQSLTTSFFRRAPKFFDIVCYTGTGGGAITLSHNLGVAPEMVIVGQRNPTNAWTASQPIWTPALALNFAVPIPSDIAPSSFNILNNTAPNSTSLSISSNAVAPWVNTAGVNAVVYLFATLAGVSKVGSYTGTGALQTIDCGFTSGARFILIRRIDSGVVQGNGSGTTYFYNSAAGISSGNDPYVKLNDGSVVAGTNYVDTHSTGFQVTAAASVVGGPNTSGGTYIFLAIA